MSIIRWSLVCWFVLGTVLASFARADDPLAKPKDPVAREHLLQGNKRYRLREFEKAIDEYKAGALREDAPVFLYNLGQCYRQLGKYEDAIWHYERFLSRARPAGEFKTAVDEFLRQMKAELEKKAMSQPPTDPAPDPVPTEPDPSPLPPAPIEHTSAWFADGLGWGLTGVGALSAATAGYLLLDASNLDDQANIEIRQDVRNQLRDKAGTRRTIGAVVGVAGVGLLATGIIRLVLHPSPSHERVARSWSVGFSRDGVQVFGSF